MFNAINEILFGEIYLFKLSNSTKCVCVKSTLISKNFNNSTKQNAWSFLKKFVEYLIPYYTVFYIISRQIYLFYIDVCIIGAIEYEFKRFFFL